MSGSTGSRCKIFHDHRQKIHKCLIEPRPDLACYGRNRRIPPSPVITISSESAPQTDTLPLLNRPFIWGISLVAALGGLLFGYDWVVIGGAKPFFEPYFQLATDDLKGWANSCALIGCLFGSLFSGRLSDTLGRKCLLIVAALLFAVSARLCSGALPAGWPSGWLPTSRLFISPRLPPLP